MLLEFFLLKLNLLRIYLEFAARKKFKFSIKKLAENRVKEEGNEIHFFGIPKSFFATPSFPYYTWFLINYIFF